MAPPKKKKKAQKAKALVYDDICYLANPNPVPARCAPQRLHCFISAWLGHQDRSDEYYDFVYKKSKRVLVRLGSADSVEGLLRKLGTALEDAKNKGKLVGDLVVLTHGVEVYDQSTGATETVKLELPLFSLKGPDGNLRSLPIWWDKTSKEIDAEHLEELQKAGSDYYEHVDGKNHAKDGLISVVAKGIAAHMDGSTHVWLVGCNLGKNVGLLKQFRKLFSDKPVVYGFTKRHFISYTVNDADEVDGGSETLRERGAKSGAKLWTEDGIKSIVHEP